MFRSLWARITKAGTNGQQFATQQMEYLGKVSDGAMLFPYGVHGNLPPDYLVLVGAVQGHPDNRVAVGCLPKTRPALEEGEVAFYHPVTGGVVRWKQNGDLEITTGSNVAINAGTLTLNGDLVVNGAMTNNGKNVGDTHGHAQGNDSGGNTEQPIVGVS